MYLKRKYASVIGAAFILLSSSFAVNAQTSYHDRTVPRLVVEIVVSHMRYDYLNRFTKNFSEYGFRRLMMGGVVCTNARYNYMFTQNSPGVATLATGTQPSQHGIIGDGWINYTTNEPISSIVDLNVMGVGCNEDEGQFSPRQMVVSTVADELKRHYKDSKVISIAQEPEGAILAGGYTPDEVYWFDERYGGWATSSYYKMFLPEWVQNFNKSGRKDEYASKLWHVSRPIEEYVFQKSNAILLDTTVKFTFDMLFKPKNKDYNRLNETPFGNSYLKDFAIEAIQNNGLGQDDIPDLLMLNFSSQKYITEYYGVESTEIEDAFYKLDQDIAELMDYLLKTVGKDNFVVVLTSNHGSSDDVRIGSGANSGTFNAMQFKVLISGFLSAQLGQENWVSEYRNRQIYLNRRLIFERGLSLPDIQNQVATFSLQFGGVAQAITATTLHTNYYGRGIMQKIQNSFFPKHSGDIIINLLPGWIELPDEESNWVTSSSGSPYEYDTHVPLLWYGANIESQVIHRGVDMMDVAPTVCDILGIAHPNASEGTAISEIVAVL